MESMDCWVGGFCFCFLFICFGLGFWGVFWFGFVLVCCFDLFFSCFLSCGVLVE